MPDSLRYLDWYSKSREDYESALILFNNRGSNTTITFHCQQAIEKALKGYILKHQTALIYGHSLVYLCRKAMEIDDFFKHFLNDCAFVNQFYIEARYPQDIPLEITDKDAIECIEIAKVDLGKIGEIRTKEQ